LALVRHQLGQTLSQLRSKDYTYVRVRVASSFVIPFGGVDGDVGLLLLMSSSVGWALIYLLSFEQQRRPCVWLHCLY
jgi:hypothetical protein